MEHRFDEDELIAVTNQQDQSATAINYIKLELALNDAKDEMDSYLQVRYSLPIVGISNRLTICQCNIARYRLHENHATEEVYERYKLELAWLKDIAKGNAGLGGNATGSLIGETPIGGNTVLVTEGNRVFGDDGILGGRKW